jgi:acyl-CoA thioester hydrolase
VPDPARLAAPFARYRTEVREEWIDYNGHLHDAGYAIVLSEANEALLGHLGLSEAYRAETGRAMYTVESHIRYLAEAKRGDVIEAASLLVSADARRMRVHTLLRRGDGVPVATGEYLYLHVDQAAGGVTAMPPDRWAAVGALLSEHAPLERPGHLGRGVGARPVPQGQAPGGAG